MRGKLKVNDDEDDGGQQCICLFVLDYVYDDALYMLCFGFYSEIL